MGPRGFSDMSERDAKLRIQMLWGFSVENGKARLDLSRQQTGSLLARLALKPGQEVSREELLAFIWPELDADEARARLRQRLYALGRQFAEAQDQGQRALVATRDAISLD